MDCDGLSGSRSGRNVWRAAVTRGVGRCAALRAFKPSGDFSLFHAAESSAGEINRLRIDAVTEKKRAAQSAALQITRTKCAAATAGTTDAE
jgi:hypothetical protein